MAGFGYILNITGDCNSQGVGIVSIIPTGGTEPYTIEWTNPPLPPINIVTNSPSTRTGLYPGTYVARLNDSTLPVNLEFYVNATVSSGCCCNVSAVSATTCGEDNGSVLVTSTTALSSVYFELYSSGGTLLNSFDSNTNQAIFTNLTAGTYYVIAEDIGGCTAKTPDFIVLESGPMSFGLYTVQNSACSNINNPIGKIYVTGQTGVPPFTYLWNNNQTGSTITGLTSGFYSVTVTDATGCQAVQNVELTDVEPLGLLYFTADTPTCFLADGTLTLYVSGGTGPYYYSASTGAVSISYAQNFSISNIPSGTYSFQVTDAGLCQLFVSTNIQTPNSIGSVTVSTTNSFCSNTQGSIQINVGQGNPPFTYTLVYPDSSSVAFTSSLPNHIFDNLDAGDYTVFVEDQSECVFSQSVTIITSNLFTINTLVTGATCNESNGSIYVVKTTGGTEPYDFAIDNVNILNDTSLTAFTFTNISPGTHVVSVTDASGCVQEQTVFVPNTPPVNFSLFGSNCGSGTEGELTAFITSGTPPFVFTWSDNVPSNPQVINVTNLTAGTYSLIVTDANGCSLSRETTITCTPLSSGYVPFEVGSESLVVTVETDLGMLEMLNDGYQDLTSGSTTCQFNSAEFFATVQVNPVGLNIQQSFYVGTTLVDVPPANLWFTAVENLLLTVPGVDSVNIDPITNQITIVKSSNNTYLDGQIINISLAIEYDINC